MRVTSAPALAVGVLAAANVLAHRVAPGATPVVAAGKVAALVLVARSAGLTRRDLGLTDWRSGLRWGAGAAAAVTAGYAAVFAVPAARSAIAGTGRDRARAVRKAVVTIPLVTVLPEEFAFRGVLPGLAGGGRSAAVATSTLFGVWHVLPALAGGPANATVDAVVGGKPRLTALRVAGTVLVTGVGGLVMAELRMRSGSLLAPVLMHWAVNGLGELVVARWRVSPPGP